MPPKSQTTQLPKTLRDELGLKASVHRPFNPSNRPRRLSKKEARKLARHPHKAAKASVNQPSQFQPKSRKRPAAEPENDQPIAKKARLGPTRDGKSVKRERRVSFADEVQQLPAKSKKTPSKTESTVKPPTALQRLSERLGHAKPSLTENIRLSKEERDEDKEIAWLEAKVGKRRSASDEDGLDDLLDDLDRIVGDARSARARPERNTSSEQSDDDELTSEDGDDGPRESSIEDGSDDESFAGFSDDPPDGDSEEAESPVSLLLEPTEPADRYVPPALRGRTADTNPSSVKEVVKSEAQLKLSRQLKGLLNKLSDQNIGLILGDIENLYRENIRNDVTACITDLIITSISNHSSLLDSFVILHGALVASLHRVIGVEFAAYFVQTLVDTYERFYAAATADSSIGDETEEPGTEPSTDAAAGKEASNLLVLLAELYTFQVVSCVLIYDIIRSFLSSKFEEFHVELFLKLLKSIGPQLRQDDPTALKDIVQLVQAKTADQDYSTLNSRTRFMIETLTNLKNNKTMDKRRVGQQNIHVAADTVDKMKKFIKSLSKGRTVRANEPLNVSLKDLHSAKDRGKWWLVGSAWSGDPLVEAAAERDVEQQGTTTDGAILASDHSAALYKLAKKQGMNTEVRRSIFVTLLSSEDFIDACDRLVQLKLGDQQRPEIIRVLLHCLGNEQSYNPYYTLVAQRLADTGLRRNVWLSLQYCLWDLFREFGEVVSSRADEDDDRRSSEEKSVSKVRIRNLARAYAWWVAKGVMTLEILKALRFTVLKPQTTSFLKTFFAQLFVSSQSASPILDYATQSNKEIATLSRDREIVEVIFVKPIKQKVVMQGILHFLNTERVEGLAPSESIQDLIRWGVKIASETLRAGRDMDDLID
ncbi:suppressor of glycerol defect [Tulasnella sp. 403]|nr:suppressor of glycerol defect [Tulasnella sp. 403]